MYYLFYYLWRHDGAKPQGVYLILMCLWGTAYAVYACIWVDLHVLNPNHFVESERTTGLSNGLVILQTTIKIPPASTGSNLFS